MSTEHWIARDKCSLDPLIKTRINLQLKSNPHLPENLFLYTSLRALKK